MNRALFTLIYVLIVCALHAKPLDSDVIASVIILEAGGEGNLGMQAVASVIKNRSIHGKSPYQVIIKPYQFSCLNASIVNKKESLERFVERARRHPRWNYACGLTEKIINNTLFDVTGGATHYFADYIGPPEWAKKMTFKKRIGRHIFYKET